MAQTHGGQKRKKISARLAEHVTPERYRLMLRPNLSDFTFSGDETIYLSLGKAARAVTLHAKDLKITSAVFLSGRGRFPARKISYDTGAETATFAFGKKLPKGRGALELRFRGKLNDKMRGFYRSRYTVKGREKYLATTQFEATDARRAFPCFDEPARKAVFDVTLAVPKGHTAISNTMPETISEHASGYKLVKFAPTPKMSTYLLAFIAGEFESIEAKTKEGVLVRVFTTPGKKEEARFALSVARRTLSFFHGYFGIPYPLPVMDLIAIPDFAAGAMENWGAVTYRESALLIHPEHSSVHTKQWVALVVAHELAHQWFGNLVTMSWWTHLWLNEGFASYIEYLAVDKLFPKWEIWKQFVFADHGAALRLDSLSTTHPIEVEVHHPDEISEIFDAVSYSKGAAVIRMLAEHLGENDFRNGLRHYLKKHQYGNAATEDLWRAFEHVSGKSVGRMMRNWTAKPGYPLITVLEGKKRLRLVQSRFFASPISEAKSKDKTIWSIPLAILGENKKRRAVFTEKKAVFMPKPQAAGAWLKINAGESALARVDYPAKFLEALQGPISRRELPVGDRLGVIRDAFALAEAGRQKTHDALELALAYRNENEYSVWAELSAGINRFDLLLAGEPMQENYRSFARKLFSGIALRVGWDKKKNESQSDALLRSLALWNFGRFGDPGTARRAKRLFAAAKQDSRAVHPDIRGLVYELTAENGGAAEFEALLAMYRREKLHEEKNRLASALASFSDPRLLARTLKFAVSKEVRAQDAVSIIAEIWENPFGREPAWEFVQDNWKLFMERYGEGGHMLPRLFSSAKFWKTEARAREFEKFFKTHKAPGAERTISQLVERIYANARWFARERDGLSRYLAARAGKD